MSALADHLRTRIASAGPISLAEFMATALTHPRHGYYMWSDPLGREGDFITAPEISQMFGELIGLWCVATWRQMGEPGSVRLVELGPGRGTLMSDALRSIATVPAFPAAASVHLVETSPVLGKLQRDALRGTGASWHDRLGQVSSGPLLLIANELFDALPVRQFQLTSKGWHERVVTVDTTSGDLIFALAPGTSLVAGLNPVSSMGAPVGSICEVSTMAISLADEIARRVVRDGGAALIIDYGPAVSEIGATLRGVRGHEAHDPLAEPGSADISADVDFMTLGRAASGAGAAVYGPIRQGRFLRLLGIEARAAMLKKKATRKQKGEINAALNRLLHKDQMGQRFKAFVIANPNLLPPAGFEAQR